MQPPIRVHLIAENDEDVHKLTRLFEQFPEFAVVHPSVAAGSVPKTFDVQIIHAEHVAQPRVLARANGPTLYLVPHGRVRPNDLRGPSAMLPPDAPASQIRAAAMAVAAGLQIKRKSDYDAAEGESEFSFVEPLTDRELHVLNLVADGLSNPQIARRLAISRNTVKFHISSIMSKVGATSRTEAVTIGVKRGLIIL